MLSQAVVLIDHHTAEIQHLGAEANVQKLKEHHHYTRQHGSNVRSEHEFFAQVCEALEHNAETLVLGAHGAQADFRHYVEKHRPKLMAKLVGWKTVDHPTPGQVAALARSFFADFDRMAGRPNAH